MRTAVLVRAVTTTKLPLLLALMTASVAAAAPPPPSVRPLEELCGVALGSPERWVIVGEMPPGCHGVVLADRDAPVHGSWVVEEHEVAEGQVETLSGWELPPRIEVDVAAGDLETGSVPTVPGLGLQEGRWSSAEGVLAVEETLLRGAEALVGSLAEPVRFDSGLHCCTVDTPILLLQLRGHRVLVVSGDEGLSARLVGDLAVEELCGEP